MDLDPAVILESDMANQTQNTNDYEGADYDRNIVSAETAARQEREGGKFKETPEGKDNTMDTTGGFTVDREGLANNYAIEPEMYVEEPGDLSE